MDHNSADLKIGVNDNNVTFAMTPELTKMIYELTKRRKMRKKSIEELEPGDQVLRRITAGNILDLESHVIEITATEIIVAGNTFTDCTYRYDLKGHSVFGDPMDRLVIP